MLDHIPVKATRSLFYDRDGCLWIGTRNELLRYYDGRLQPLEIQGVDSMANFLCFFEDREGTLWGGTGNTGRLVRLTDAKVVNLTRNDGLPVRSVLSVLKTSDQALWIGSWGGGLIRQTKGGLENIRTSDGLGDESICSLREAPDGALWIGYYGSGVGRLQDGKFTHYKDGPGLDTRLRDIEVGPDGTVWVVTLRCGLLRLEGGRFVKFELPDMPQPTAMHPETGGRLWIASADGLGLFDTATRRWLVQFHEPPGRTDAAVSMRRGEGDDLWVLRDGCMVQRLHAGKLEEFKLPSQVGILTYDGVVYRGSLWVNFRNGVARIPLREFDAVVAGRKSAV